MLGAYAGVDRTAFRYREVQLAPAGAAAAANMARNAAVPPAKLRQLRERGRLPSPGGGPSPERRAASSFLCVPVARSASSEAAAVAISGGDPGYDETAKMVAEAAFTLLEADRDSLPSATLGAAGVLTPAAALGDVYARRLQAAGLLFEDGFDLGRLPGEPDRVATS